MDSRTWQQPQPRGSVYAEKTTWLLVAAFALLLAGLMVNQSTTAFFTDTRVVSGNNFITASVALNETPFTAFNFEKFVPGDVFVRPVQVTNSTASNSGAINVNYYMTVKDNFSNCSTQDPKCTDAKGTLSDPVNGLRLVAIRCFSDDKGTTNVACESASLRSVRLIKGAMETIWPGGATNATTDIAGVVRDRNETVQYGNVGGTGSEAISNFPGLPNNGNASDYFG
ncbi:MAG: TasA family protein, partial [Chloroflexota bacterium]